MKYIIILMLCSLGNGAVANVNWLVDRVETNAAMGTTSLEVIYRLKNEGTEPVKFEKCDNCCGVRVLKQPLVCNPGETAEIVVRADTRNVYGSVYKNIFVEYGKETKALVLIYEVPAIVNVAPKRLMWSDDDFSEKTIIVSDLSDNNIQITSIFSDYTNDHFIVTADTTQNTGEVIIRVEPKMTAEKGNFPMDISFDYLLDDGSFLKKYVYLTVQ